MTYQPRTHARSRARNRAYLRHALREREGGRESERTSKRRIYTRFNTYTYGEKLSANNTRAIGDSAELPVACARDKTAISGSQRSYRALMSARGMRVSRARADFFYRIWRRTIFAESLLRFLLRFRAKSLRMPHVRAYYMYITYYIYAGVDNFLRRNRSARLIEIRDAKFCDAREFYRAIC